MKLSRALGKFATSPVTRWNSSTKQWVDTGCTGSLLVFDRFVTERTFGQKKRILIVPFESRLDMAKATILRVGDAFETFLLEKENSDVRFGNVYGYTYLRRRDQGQERCHRPVLDMDRHRPLRRGTVEEVRGDRVLPADLDVRQRPYARYGHVRGR